MLKLDKGLQAFLKEAIEEEAGVTVEGSRRKELTRAEEEYLNSQLNPLGFAVKCFKCDVCFGHSGGTHPYHIERITLKDGGMFYGQTD